MPLPIPPGSLVMLIGPAGSGKSTLVRDLVHDLPADTVVSLDELRARVSGDPGDQAATADAVQLQDLIVEARLARGLTVILDSTNTDAFVRAGLLERARRHQRPAVAVALITPLATCLTRNAQRTGSARVPGDVIRRQHALAAQALSELPGEGFSRVLTY